MSNDAQFLTRKKAGEWLQKNFGVSSRHALAKAGRQGPPYKICGRNALYRPEDLQRWIEARLTDPAVFKRGRPDNLLKRKRAGGGADATQAQGIAAPPLEQNHDAALAKAFDVLRALGLQT